MVENNGINTSKNIIVNANIVFTILTSILLALGGWGLIKLTTMSDAFATKDMVLDIAEKHEKDIKCVGDDAKNNLLHTETKLEKRIDRFEDNVMRKIDHIQESLEKFQYEGRQTEVKRNK